MPTTIELITKNQQSIVVQLLDNPFVAEFTEQLRYAVDTYPIKSYRERVPAISEPAPWNQAFVDLTQRELRTTVRALNEMGLDFPVSADDIVLDLETGRQLLNRLHRHFTTGHRSFSTGETQGIWQDGTNWTFTIPNDREKFSRLVHRINEAVHNIERLFYNDRIRNFNRKYEYQILFDNKHPHKLETRDYFYPIKPEHEQYFSDQLEYDVWLPLHQIQGKTYWTCYFDQDEPTHWDVTHNKIYSGSFTLTDRSAARDPAILEWLQSYGITPGPLHCGMPLGNIIQGKELVDSLGLESVTEVKVHG
jgi:hypothetical protein